MSDLLLIVLGTVLVNHFVLSGLPGLKSVKHSDEPFAAAVVAFSTGIVMLMTAALALATQHWLLAPLEADYLRLLVVVTAASGATWLLSLHFDRSPSRTKGNKPLVISNGIVLVLALQNVVAGRDWLAVAVIAASLAIAFGSLLLAFTELLNRIEQAAVPRLFRGAPLAFFTAGLAALALLGLTGLLPS